MKVDLNNLRHLLNKYYSGETSIEEENALRYFFLNEPYPDEFEADSLIFSINQPDSKSDDIDTINEAINRAIFTGVREKSSRKNFRIMNFKWASAIAASVLLLLSLGWFFASKNETKTLTDTYNDPVIAYEQTKKILLMISGGINKGLTGIESFSEINHSLQKLSPIAEMPKQMERFSAIQIMDNPLLVRESEKK